MATTLNKVSSGKEGFVRGLKLFDATTLVVGTMIGSGIFIVSADIARTVNSVWLMLAVWAIAGVLTIIGALSYAELTAAMPKAGGQYVFLREAFGNMPAFLYGWTFFLVIGTGITAAVSVGFAKFLGVFFPAVSSSNMLINIGIVKVSTQQFVAMLVISLLTYVNCRGVKDGALVQNIFTVLKVLAVVLLVVAAFTIGRDPSVAAANFSGFSTGGFSGLGIATTLGVAMVGALFAMDAWAFVCFTAGEVENPSKNLPKALFFGVLAVVVLYLIVNVAYMYVLPFAGIQTGADIVSRGIQYATEDRVATAVTEMMLGGAGLYVIAAAIMISTFGCVNGNILMSSRMFYALAKDGLFFSAVGRINPKTHVPVTALIVGAAWACLLTLSGSYGQLLDYVIFATLIFYALTIVGLIVLRRKKPELERPYKAWGYPWPQIVYIVAAALICVDLLIYKPDYTWPGLFIVLSGVPVYYIRRSLPAIGRMFRRPAEENE